MERRPTRNASEKFRVAREERNMPRRRREKDFMRVYCCVVGWKEEISVSERRRGRRRLRREKIAKTGGRSWEVLAGYRCTDSDLHCVAGDS